MKRFHGRPDFPTETVENFDRLLKKCSEWLQDMMIVTKLHTRTKERTSGRKIHRKNEKTPVAVCRKKVRRFQIQHQVNWTWHKIIWDQSLTGKVEVVKDQKTNSETYQECNSFLGSNEFLSKKFGNSSAKRNETQKFFKRNTD